MCKNPIKLSLSLIKNRITMSAVQKIQLVDYKNSLMIFIQMY